MTSFNLKIKPVTGIKFKLMPLREGIQNDILSLKQYITILNKNTLNQVTAVIAKTLRELCVF